MNANWCRQKIIVCHFEKLTRNPVGWQKNLKQMCDAILIVCYPCRLNSEMKWVKILWISSQLLSSTLHSSTNFHSESLNLFKKSRTSAVCRFFPHICDSQSNPLSHSFHNACMYAHSRSFERFPVAQMARFLLPLKLTSIEHSEMWNVHLSVGQNNSHYGRCGLCNGFCFICYSHSSLHTSTIQLCCIFSPSRNNVNKKEFLKFTEEKNNCWKMQENNEQVLLDVGYYDAHYCPHFYYDYYCV
jgi:hypothetical protein